MCSADEVRQHLQYVLSEFDRYCVSYNAGSEIEKKSWDHRLGPLHVAISRGTVFEKASCIFCDLQIETPPVLAEQTGYKEPTMECLVLEIGIHPFNPHVPKGYIELRANIAGSVILAGGTDIFPYFPDTADNELFASNVRQTCEIHGVDYEHLRKVRADFFRSKYRDSSVGSHAGIYFFALESSHLPFFKDMTSAFFSTYGTIVERSRDKPFSDDDKMHQHRLHGEWAQWIMTEDEGTRFGLEQGIPPEALLGAILPPVAVF